MDKLNSVFQVGIFVLGCTGVYTALKFKKNKDKRKQSRSYNSDFNDEMDSLVNARIPRMNNQIPFNLRDQYFNRNFFEK